MNRIAWPGCLCLPDKARDVPSAHPLQGRGVNAPVHTLTASLLALCLSLGLVGSVVAQSKPTITSGETAINYTENDTAPVATYMATAVSGETITGWTLGGTDAGDFVITGTTSGELAFKYPSNFEAPYDADRDNIYEITIIATDSGGTESDPRMVTVTVIDVDENPAPVTALMAAPGDGQVELSWTAPASFGEGNTGIRVYVIDVTPNDVVRQSAPGSDTTRTITRLTNDVQYTFSVVAYGDVDGISTAVTVMATPVAGATLASLTIADNSGVAVDLGRPRRYEGPTFASDTYVYTARVANAVPSVTVTPAVSNPAATVTVEANAVTSGTASQLIPLAVGVNEIDIVVTLGGDTQTYTVTVTRAINTAPVVTLDLIRLTRLTGGEVTLKGVVIDEGLVSYSWTQADCRGSAGAPGSADCPSVTLNGADTDTATFTAPDTPATLIFTLTATDAGEPGMSGSADAVVVVLQGARAPGAPSNAQANPLLLGGADSFGIILSWEEPADIGTSPIRHYEYRYRRVSAAEYGEWVMAGYHSQQQLFVFDGTDIVVGVGYFFEVRVVNDAGPGRVAEVPFTSPDAPSSLMASPGGARVTLTWMTADDGGPPISRYQYRQSTTGGDSSVTGWRDVPGSSSTTTRYTVPGLTAGTAYFFRVRAVNSVGEGASSGEVSATPTDTSLSGLRVSQGTLSPVFAPGISDYAVTVTHHVTDVTVTPTVSNAAATVTVNTDAVTSSTASQGIPLAVDSETRIDIVVTLGSATQPYTVTITRRANQPPYAHAGYEQDASSGALVTLDGSRSADRDGGTIAYAWSQISGPDVTLTGADTVMPSFTAPVVRSQAILIFALTVTDNSGGTSGSGIATGGVSIIRNTVNIRVTLNTAPTADAGADRVVRDREIVVLDGSASSDPNRGDSLTYAWEQTSGPVTVTVNVTDATSAFANFRAPSDTGDFVFTLTVTDRAGVIATDTVTITVNAKPIATTGPDRTVSSGVPVILDGSASSDPGGTIVRYSWSVTSKSPGDLIVNITEDGTNVDNPATPNAQFTTEPDTVALLKFNLTVADDKGFTGQNEVNIRVIIPNIAPTADAGADRVVRDREFVVLDGSRSSDPDRDRGDSLTYAWSQTSGPVTVNVTDATSAFANFLAPSDTGDFVFTLTVTDRAGVIATDTVTIIVSAEPIATTGPDRTVSSGVPVILDGSASGYPGGTIVSYSWSVTSKSPRDLIVNITEDGTNVDNPATPNAQFTTDPGTVGLLKFKLTVTDDKGLTGQSEVTIRVSIPNIAPTADAGADQVVRDGGIVVLDGSASSDPDLGRGDSLTYAWEQTSGPVTVTVNVTDATSAFANFRAPSDAGDTGDFVFTLTVTDRAGAIATDTVTITVNAKPIATTGPDRTVSSGAPVMLDGSASRDPGGTIVSYSWSVTSKSPRDLSVNITEDGTNVDNPATHNAQFTTEPGTVALLKFKLTVTDDKGFTGQNEVTIRVSIPNIAPTADAGADRVVRDREFVVLDGSRSSDPDRDRGDSLTYAWSQTSGPVTVNVTDATSAFANFLAPSDTGDFVFTLTVTDRAGVIATDTVTITVNAKPIATTGPDRTVSSGVPVILDGSASRDPGGTIVSYSWSVTSKSPRDLIVNITEDGTNVDNPATPNAQFTTEPGTVALLNFRLTVTDDKGLTGQNSVTIRVTPPPLPVPIVSITNLVADVLTTRGMTTLTWDAYPGFSGTYAIQRVSSDNYLPVLDNFENHQTTDATSITLDVGLTGLQTYRITAPDPDPDNPGNTLLSDVVEAARLYRVSDSGGEPLSPQYQYVVAPDEPTTLDFRFTPVGKIRPASHVVGSGAVSALQSATTAQGGRVAVISTDALYRRTGKLLRCTGSEDALIAEDITRQVRYTPPAGGRRGEDTFVIQRQKVYFQERSLRNTGFCYADGATEDVTITLHSEPPTIMGDATVNYAENRADAVATYTTSHAEGDTITLTLEGTDEALFAIDSATGGLTFRVPPDYENSGDDDTDNDYEVTVIATSDGVPSMPAEVEVTVTVDNVDEPGMVTVTGTARVGSTLTATLTDLDGSISSESWQWRRAPSGGSYGDISGATDATYPLAVADEDHTLQVVASYTDGEGSDKTVTSAPTAVVAGADAPDAPGITLAADTGAADNDGITRNAQVDVTLDGSATAWEYSTNSGMSYTTGTGAAPNVNFMLPEGTYEANQVQVRQTVGGEQSAVASLGVVTVDTTTPTGVFAALPDLVVGEAVMVTFTLSEPVERALSIGDFTITNARGPSSLSRSDLVYTITFTPDAAVETRITFAGGVMDAAGNDVATVTSMGTAELPNQPPVANAGADQPDVPTGATVMLDGSASSDFDGTIATYAWSQTSGSPAVTLSTTAVARPTFTAPGAAATLVFSLIVTDNDGASSTTDTVTITVVEPLSNDATLSSLMLSAGTLVPVFAPNINTYTAVVANDVTSIAVTPTTADTEASVTVNTMTVASGDASDAIALGVGDTLITIMVTAENATTQNYALTVTRSEPPNTQPVIATTRQLVMYAEHTPVTTVVATYALTTASMDLTETIVWSLGGPDGALFAIDSATGELTFNVSPDYENPGDSGTDNDYAVTVIAIDNGAPPMSGELAVTVAVTNTDEQGTVIVTGTAQVDSTLTASTPEDPDGSVSSISWRWQRAPSVGDGTYTNIDSATAATYTSVAADVGYTLQVVASYTDGHGSGKTATSAPTAMVVSAAVPAAPDIALAADTGTAGDDGTTRNAQVDVTLDGSATAWEYSTNSGTSYMPGIGTPPNVNFMLPEGAYETNQVQVRQTVGGEKSAAASLNAVTVDTTAPTVASFEDITGATADTQTTTTIIFSEAVTGLAATDFSISPNDAMTAVSGGPTSYTVTYTPTRVPFTLTLAANSVMDTAGNTAPAAPAAVQGTAMPVINQPPTASAGSAETVAFGASVMLDGRASSDSDGMIETYAWTQSSGSPAVTLTGADTERPTFTAPGAAATLVFRLTVTDDDGAIATAVVTITVAAAPPNQPPTASAGSAETVAFGASVMLDGRASSDSDGMIETYAWSQSSGSPAVTLTGADTERPTFTAPATAATLVFSLIVTDDDGATATAMVTITVAAAPSNQPPTASAGSAEAVAFSARVTLDGSASSDSDGTIETYAWSQSSGSPSVTLSDAAAVSPTFTAPDTAATLVFSLIVTDNAGATATAMVTITVDRAELPEMLPEMETEVVLGALGRSLVQGVSAVVQGRFNARPAESFSQASLLDVLSLHPGTEGTFDPGQLLRDVEFAYALGAAEDGGKGTGTALTVWGSGEWRQLSGNPEVGGNRLDYDGDSYSMHVGADVRIDGTLLGLSVGYNQGSLEYEGASGGTERLESDFVMLSPYISRELVPGMMVWGTAGYGEGEVESKLLGQESDASLWSVAAGLGGRMELAGAGDVALSATAAVAQTEVDGSGGIPELRARAYWLRGEAQAGYRMKFGSGHARPFLLGAVRHDAGDAGKGTAIEVGGGLELQSAHGLDVELRGRVQVNSTENEEHGLGGSMRYDRGRDGRGLRFSLSPALGATSQSGLDTSQPAGATSGVGRGVSLRGELGYGMGARGGLWNPFGRMQWQGDSQRWSTGLLLQWRPGVEFELEAERHHTGGSVGHGGMFNTRLRF